MRIARGIFFDGVTDRSRVAGQTCGSRGYIRQIGDWVAVRVGKAPLEGNGLTCPGNVQHRWVVHW
jgi:hypothetical protein